MTSIGQENKKRYSFLFRREKTKGDSVYQFPDIASMTSSEVDAEIIMWWRQDQRRGLLPCEDISVLNEKPKLPKNEHEFVGDEMQEVFSSSPNVIHMQDPPSVHEPIVHRPIANYPHLKPIKLRKIKRW